MSDCIDNTAAAHLYSNWCVWQATIKDPTPNRNYYNRQPFHNVARQGFEHVQFAPDIPLAEATETALLKMPQHLFDALRCKHCMGLSDFDAAKYLRINERTVRKHSTAGLSWLAESWCRMAEAQMR